MRFTQEKKETICSYKIFVVFQRDNPEIRLIPRNMTNGVLSMWKHVTG